MKNKLIVRISNGLGNQLFLYSSAYAISKKINKKLEIDDESGFIDEARKIKYELNNFNITSEITSKRFKFNTPFKKVLRKTYKKFDLLRNNKKFLIEDKNKKSFINYSQKYFNKQYQDVVFMEGYFQSEKYFNNYQNEIRLELSFKNHIIQNNLEIQKDLLNTNSVLLHIRNHVFSETTQKKSKLNNLEQSNIYTKKTIEHCKKAINFFKEKLVDPKFFIFSNDFSLINQTFVGREFKLINNNKNNNPIDDFYLMTLCKHFIISPSTFSWWAAWLSKNKYKICVKPPKDLPMSNNFDIYPNEWISI